MRLSDQGRSWRLRKAGDSREWDLKDVRRRKGDGCWAGGGVGAVSVANALIWRCVRTWRITALRQPSGRRTGRAFMVGGGDGIGEHRFVVVDYRGFGDAGEKAAARKHPTLRRGLCRDSAESTSRLHLKFKRHVSARERLASLIAIRI